MWAFIGTKNFQPAIGKIKDFKIRPFSSALYSSSRAAWLHFKAKWNSHESYIFINLMASCSFHFSKKPQKLRKKRKTVWAFELRVGCWVLGVLNFPDAFAAIATEGPDMRPSDSTAECYTKIKCLCYPGKCQAKSMPPVKKASRSGR
jgi:hypothetical protein